MPSTGTTKVATLNDNQVGTSSHYSMVWVGLELISLEVSKYRDYTTAPQDLKIHTVALLE